MAPDSDTQDPASVLSSIPKGHRKALLGAFNSIVKNFREGRWEPSELNGGKLCEVVYSILEGHTSGKYASRPRGPRNMPDACRAFEQLPKTSFPQSIRVTIPRLLPALYEIRNQRGVGHIGGDVDPNHMDALAVLGMSKWIMAELVRIFHNTDVQTATEIVELLVDRTIPVVWHVGGKRRILNTQLPYKDQMMIILYEHGGAVAEQDVLEWLEHSNASVFRRDIVRPAHRSRAIDYDEDARTLQISPTGVAYVEDNLPLDI